MRPSCSSLRGANVQSNMAAVTFRGFYVTGTFCMCCLSLTDGTFSVQTIYLSLCIFHFVLNKSWMVAVNEPKACLNAKQSLSQLTRFGF